MKFTTYRFVKGEDLNHHGTLFAGRAAEWFVETGLMTVAQHVPAEGIVCVNVHEMRYRKPIKLGGLIEATGKIVLVGNSSFIVHIEFKVDNEVIVSGYVSYVYVDEKGKTKAHNVTLKLQKEDEVLAERAKYFKETSGHK